MIPTSIAIIGAAQPPGSASSPTCRRLYVDAALNAMTDAGRKPADIDGIATAGKTPVTVAHSRPAQRADRCSGYRDLSECATPRKCQRAW
jgi:hypothetical protein